jgi:carbonic anhydrase
VRLGSLKFILISPIDFGFIAHFFSSAYSSHFTYQQGFKPKMKAHNSMTQAQITPAISLQFLKEGNLRFVNNLKANRDLLEQANETRDGQWPFAAILSCIDSRTSAELIFDQGLGDIISIRIAGNVVNTDVIGSLEFACRVLGSRLIVVLGHTSCGAVKGACDHVEMGNLTELLSKILPSVYQESKGLDFEKCNSKNADYVEKVTNSNIRMCVNSIVNRSHILGDMINSGEIAIIGGKHDLNSGLVEFFQDSWIGTSRDNGKASRDDRETGALTAIQSHGEQNA